MVFILANSAAARTQRQAGASGLVTGIPHSAFRIPHLQRVGLKRASRCRILSKHDNSTLATLQEILKPLGLRVSGALAEAA